MNILIVSHFYPPHQGGVETAAFNMAKHLKNRFNCNTNTSVMLIAKITLASHGRQAIVKTASSKQNMIIAVKKRKNSAVKRG